MRLLEGFAIVLLSAFASLANAAAPPVPANVLNIDLEPAIRESALRPERFAVDVPASASIATDGAWSRASGVSTWRHALRIPTAVSMSFHARTLVLPAGATLRVTAGASSVVYRQSDASMAGLWGRVLKGDTLAFEITVPTSREADVVFDLASLQAGYRGLGGAVADHPAYKKLQAMNAAASAATCLENFACHETAGNFGPRNATAAIVVSGVALCTATLINNLREDTSPYILTARHCEVDDNSAASVILYWDATVPCAAALASVYDTLTPAYTGGGTHTLVEQQDVWLLEFGSTLSANHTFFSGWDATGGTFVGGYSPHHAQGRSRQYAGWFGQALLHDISNSALGSGYRGTFWGVVNEVGSIGSGASGGGLFDSNNRLVGTLSLGLLPAGGGDGMCPAASPKAPTSSNTVGEYNAFAAVWDSTADTTSTTNPRTLKSVLDPDNTGLKVVDGFEWLKGAYISPDQGSAFTGSQVRLTWNAPGATACTAEGGHTGDGWSGSLGASGTRNVTATDAGAIRYAMRCTDGTRKTYVWARVQWDAAPATLNFFGDSNDTFVGQSKRLTWSSNVTPCIATGGVTGDGWAGTKAQSGTQDVVLGPGSTTFTLACGSGGRVASYSLVVSSWPVSAYLLSVGLVDNLRVGQFLDLAAAGGPSCVRSGGAAGDGWSTSTGADMPVTETVPGTYTYTITCTGGGQTATQSITRTFNGSAPFATLVATPNRFEAGPGGPVADGSHGQGAELRWNSNLPSCELIVTGPGGVNAHLGFGQLFNADYWRDLQPVAGFYNYTVTCSGGGQTASATTTIEFFASQPNVRLTVPATFAANQAVPIQWESNVFPCTASQGAAGDGWAGPKATASGSQALTETAPGTYVYDITCGSGASTARAEATATVPVPGVTVTPQSSHITVGFFATIDWSASTGPCVLSSNPANNDWSGTHFSSGRAFVTQQIAGTYTYTATCGPAGATVNGSGQVIFDPSPFPTSTFTASSTSARINEPITLTWSATNTDYCVASANTTVADWNGPVGISGTATVTRTFPGVVSYFLSCNGAAMKEVQLTFSGPVDSPNPFIPPNVTLSASHTQRITGEMVTLTWSSTHASECTAAGGQSGDGWTGALSLSATQTVTETTPGNYNYFVLCSGAPPSAQAMVTVQFLAPAPAPSSGGSNAAGGGGKGGGGRLDWLMLAFLALMISQAARVRRGSARA